MIAVLLAGGLGTRISDLLRVSALVRGNREAACAFNFGPHNRRQCGSRRRAVEAAAPLAGADLAARRERWRQSRAARGWCAVSGFQSGAARSWLETPLTTRAALEQTASSYREVAINPAQATTFTQRQIEESSSPRCRPIYMTR